jgi:hypothetical protein
VTSLLYVVPEADANQLVAAPTKAKWKLVNINSVMGIVGRPLFWSAGRLSAAQWTTKMIVDQRTGKNSGLVKIADQRQKIND